MPQTTAPVDGIDNYGYPSRLVLDLNDDSHAISSLYRSDEIKKHNKFAALILVL